MKKLVVFSLLLVMLITACNQPVQLTKSAGVTLEQEAVESRTAVPSWDRNKVYSTAGTQVSWNGKIWENKWWADFTNEPGKEQWGPWKEVTTVNPVLSVSLTASAATVKEGESVTLTWTVANGTQVTASGAWSGSKALTGSEVVGPLTTNSTFTLTAVDSAGKSQSKTVTVTVEKGQVTKPVITLTASPATITAGGTATLNWTVNNATSVVASGAWAGNKALSGTEVTAALNTTSVFTLTATDAQGQTAVQSVTVTVTSGGGDNPLKEGESRVLTDAQIDAIWGGIDPQYSPAAVANTVPSLMTKAAYEKLFPRRYGTALWTETSGKVAEEYFTYENLVNALTDIAALKVRVETKRYAQRVFRLNKATKTETLLRQDADYTADWLKNVVPKVEIVDYGKFLNEGTTEIRKRDLAAFLGNLAHETTGGWDTAPGGRFAWGFYFKEEVGYNDNSVGGYVSANHANYPAKPGESYHGRGPIQLSWNYNYGFMSQIIYGDKMILLNNPDSVAHDGKLGFMTAIWFWMTPQSPKPACHDVMAGNWEPTPEDIAANRLPGFGVTINVINGGLEAGRPDDYRVKDRIGFYEMICAEFGITTGPNVDCYTQKPF